MQRLIDSCLVEAELQRRDVEVTPEDVQTTIDDMRRRRGLLTIDDTRTWLAESGMSLHGLTDLATKLARAAKLRDLIVGKEVDAYLEQHRRSFDVVTVRVLQTPNQRVASDTAQAVRDRTGTFMDVAQAAFTQDATGRTSLFYRKEPRHRLEAKLGAEAATLAAGALIGPVAEGNEHTLIHVVSIEPAERNAGLRSRVVAKLFEDWLREQRKAARIEWFWGSAQQTDNISDATK
jgi:putative peptide maturation system protein